MDIWKLLSKSSIKYRQELQKKLLTLGIKSLSKEPRFKISSIDITIDKPVLPGFDFMSDNEISSRLSDRIQNMEAMYYYNEDPDCGFISAVNLETGKRLADTTPRSACKTYRYNGVPALKAFLLDDTILFFYIKERPRFRMRKQGFYSELLRIERRIVFKDKNQKLKEWTKYGSAIPYTAFKSYSELVSLIRQLFKQNHGGLMDYLNVDTSINDVGVRKVLPILIESFFRKFSSTISYDLIYGDNTISAEKLELLASSKEIDTAVNRGLIKAFPVKAERLLEDGGKRDFIKEWRYRLQMQNILNLIKSTGMHDFALMNDLKSIGSMPQDIVELDEIPEHLL